MNENMISVTQFSNYVKQIFNAEELLHNISIYGEVSDFKISRGVGYFSLKDEESLLPCVAFGVEEFDYIPAEGDMVIVCGSPNYYTKGGRFSFVVKDIQSYGIGVLYQKFLQMKEKLEKEGLFDAKYKKPLPKNIKKIGVVTSETGAVIQDIIDITRRRNPMLNILIYPAKVQGIGADVTINQGIKELDKTDVDLIIVARGGGSLEDLSPFNTEIVARAIFDAQKMVISAVGHETDFTIADFVADLRAPTPSAAAELVSVDLSALIESLNMSIYKMNQKAQSFVKNNYENIFDLSNDLITNYSNLLQNKSLLFKQDVLKLSHLFDLGFKDKERALELVTNKLELNNPLKILKNGYAFLDQGQKRIKSIKDIEKDQELNINLYDGVVTAKVLDKRSTK